MDPKLMAMLAALGHVMCIENPSGEAGGDANAAPAAAPTPAPSEPQGDPAELGEAGKKALAAERKRADDAEKARRALEAQLQEKDNASLTETQRLQKQIEELQASYQASQLEAARSRVIATEGISPALASFVQGADEAELLASAQALKAALADATKPGTPIPDPSQGSHPPVDAVAHSAPGSARLAAAFDQQLSTRK